MRNIFLILVVVVAFFTGCGDNSNIENDQITSIETFLKDEKYDKLSGVYRVVKNADREGYDAIPKVNKGDSVGYYFAIYEFDSNIGGLVYTNIKTIIESDTVLNSKYWSFDRRMIKLGSAPDLASVQNGIEGSRLGDSLLLFIPSKNAFGDKQNGVIPPNTSLVYEITIDKVN